MGAAGSAVSPDIARLILQITAILGAFGALTPLIIFVLKRKTELRALDTTSDSTLAGAMSTFLGEVRIDRGEDREEIKALKDESRGLADEVRNLRLELQAADLAIGAERRSREYIVTEMEAMKEDLRLARLKIDSLHRRLGPLADPVAGVDQILKDNREP